MFITLPKVDIFRPFFIRLSLSYSVFNRVRNYTSIKLEASVLSNLLSFSIAKSVDTNREITAFSF